MKISQSVIFVNTERLGANNADRVQLMAMDSVAKRIRFARKLRGLTQEGLMHACGWEYQSRVSGYEKDGPEGREPSISDLVLLSKALQVSLTWLASGEGEYLESALSQGVKSIEAAKVIEKVQSLDNGSGVPTWLSNAIVLLIDGIAVQHPVSNPRKASLAQGKLLAGKEDAAMARKAAQGNEAQFREELASQDAKEVKTKQRRIRISEKQK